jgi:hypothetical protein
VVFDWWRASEFIPAIKELHVEARLGWLVCCQSSTVPKLRVKTRGNIAVTGYNTTFVRGDERGAAGVATLDVESLGTSNRKS